MPSSWIEHNGKKILYTDFKNCSSEESMIATLQEAADIYAKHTQKILGLFDMTETTITDRYMQHAKELGEKVFNVKREKSAILGIRGIKKVLLDAYNQHANNELVPFDDMQQALDYLTS